MNLKLKGKTALITGGANGIGEEISQKLASEGVNIYVTTRDSKNLIKLKKKLRNYNVKVGGVVLDFLKKNYVSKVKNLLKKVNIDILINNASAIQLTGTLETEMKRYDLMHQINVRGTYMVSKYCIPYLKKANNPHILNLSPPLNMETKWFAPHVAYTMSKFGMSMCVLGMAGELKKDGIAVNALWPKTVIQTAAVQNLLGGDKVMEKARKPDIMGDAAFTILSKDSSECTGNYFVDEELLRSEGITDFSNYSNVPDSELMPDFFI